MDNILCAVAEFGLLITSVSTEELVSVEGVGLSGGEEDVFGVSFLLRSSASVVAHVSLWLDVIDLALSVDDDWLPIEVLDVTVMVVLLGVLVVGVGMSVLLVRIVMAMSVVFEALESLQLVPESSVLNGLDLGGLSESWLIGDGELLLVELNLLDGLVLRSVVLVLVAGVVSSVPGRGSSEQEGSGEGSHNGK